MYIQWLKVALVYKFCNNTRVNNNWWLDKCTCVVSEM